MTDDLAEARAALERGKPGWAHRKAWDAAIAAEDARDAETLDEVRALASQIEERAEGSTREEAHRLGVYCEACSADIRAGVPHDSTLSRLFRRT
ncbi:MAG TPA: hypothetical protein VMT59_13350 [Gaiellaceae bacterium]|nr:hypothetical protein [Gaiellaceae bacterium]